MSETRGGCEAEQREREALRELLSRRRTGEFISAEEMDARLKRMIAGKKRSCGVEV